MFLAPLAEAPPIGRKPVYLVTLLIFVVFNFAIVYAPNIATLLVFRFLTVSQITFNYQVRSLIVLGFYRVSCPSNRRSIVSRSLVEKEGGLRHQYLGSRCCVRSCAWAIGRWFRCTTRDLEMDDLGADLVIWILLCGTRLHTARDQCKHNSPQTSQTPP